MTAGHSIGGIMNKYLTAQMTAGLLVLLIALSVVTGTVVAADDEIPAPGFIGEQGVYEFGQEIHHYGPRNFKEVLNY